MRIRCILVSCCITFLSVSGNHCHPAGTNTDSRRILASRDSPFAKELNKSVDARKAVGVLLGLIRGEDERKSRKMRAYSYSTNQQVLCNVRLSDDVLNGISSTFASTGLGDVSNPCTMDIHLEARGAWHAALQDYIAAVTGAASSVLQRIRTTLPNPECFTKAHPYFEFKYKDRLQSCTLQHVSAIYARNRWSLSAQLTNSEPASFPAEWHRLYLSENVYPSDSGALESMLMHVNEQNGTTSLSFWGGSPATTRFWGVADVADNPAVREALRLADAREQAETMLFGSNIAILFVPVICALVPVSAFSDSSRMVTVLYVLVTDCFAMLPAAIKGIELVLFASYRPESMVLRLYGPQGESGATELWYAQRETSKILYIEGVVLLLFAVALMALGILLEVVARRMMQGSKRQYLEITRSMERQFTRSLEDVRRTSQLGENVDVSRTHLFSNTRLGIVGEVDSFGEYNNWV